MTNISKLERCAWAAEVISSVVLVGSVCIAVLAYFNETDKQRRQFTMELAMQYFSGDLQDAKNELFYTIREAQMSVAPVRLGPSDLNTYLSKAGTVPPSTDRDLNSALLAVTSFFNSASRCVEAGLCERSLMNELIGSDATSIHCVFSGYLSSMAAASNVGNLMTGLQEFNSGDCS